MQWLRAKSAFRIFSFSLLLVACPLAGQEASSSARRLITRAAPVYPELARRTNLTGIVRLVLLISPDGKVKSTEVVGGNPILVMAATEAVQKWKYEPSAQDTKERVELRFVPR